MRRVPLCKNTLSSWLLFIELSADRSFLCPLSMKYTLASGKEALPSISASEIKRRISFFWSKSELSAFSSFIFPCLRESGTTVLSGMTAPGGGGTRERAGENCRRVGERQSCSSAFGQGRGCPALPSSGRGRTVPLCRRQTRTGRSLRRQPETSARQSVFWGWAVASVRQARPPRRRGVPFPALLPVGFTGGLSSAGLPAAGKRFFFKIIITNPLEFVNRALAVCFFGRAFVHNNEKSGGGSNRLRAGALTAS